MMIQLIKRAFPDWSPAPVKGVSISSSGILALANLSIIANRTIITGTSSWFDVLVLVPGLYIRPSTDDRTIEIINLHTGETSELSNPQTGQYLKRIAEKNNPARKTVIIDVATGRRRHHYGGRRIGLQGQIIEYDHPPDPYASELFYAPVPLMTIGAIIVMTLAQDWWGLGIILCLILARFLNVYVIRARISVLPPVSVGPNAHEAWWILIPGDRRVCLRGLRHDLEAFTQGMWMRPKTNIEDCMDAAATLIVFLIAIFSNNSTQLSDIVLIVLLLTSAGLLALSNVYATTFHMNDRTAYPHLSPEGANAASQTGAPTPSSPSREEMNKAAANGSKQQPLEEANASGRRIYSSGDGIDNV